MSDHDELLKRAEEYAERHGGLLVSDLAAALRESERQLRLMGEHANSLARERDGWRDKTDATRKDAQASLDVALAASPIGVQILQESNSTAVTAVTAATAADAYLANVKKLQDEIAALEAERSEHLGKIHKLEPDDLHAECTKMIAGLRDRLYSTSWLSDECGALKSENDRLTLENARMRRRLGG